MQRILMGVLFMLQSFIAYAVINSAPITLNVNQSHFVITLPSNPSTGYQWKVTQFDNSFLTLVSSNYVAPRANFIGGEGQMLFTFRLIPGKPYPDTTKIFLSYQRPWKPQTATLKTVTIHFTPLSP